MLNVLRPQGMVERMADRHRRPATLSGYGRDKDGSPKSARTIRIAAESDRRQDSRQDGDPWRGRLIDVST